MSKTIPCEIIQDLLPSYADHLLSPKSEEYVRQHLENCETCREIYHQMNAAEPDKESDQPAVDYLKKVKKDRTKTVVILCTAACLLIAGILTYFSVSASRPRVLYNEDSSTIVISGKAGYDKVKIPAKAENAANLDVQDDNYHLFAYLPILRINGETKASFIPSYLERTDQSLRFLTDYLRENAPEIYSSNMADKFTEITIRDANSYSYKNSEDRISVELGYYYWHLEEMYLLAFMEAPAVEWQQLGYVWYLGSCLNPYYDQNLDMSSLKNEPYYDVYIRMGGTLDNQSAENMKIFYDAISYVCLTKGMHWGTAYESYPVYETAFYTGAKKALGGNHLSVIMASSLIRWLSDQYGFDKVSSYCFGKTTFEEVFGIHYQEAYDRWSSQILSY